jgi:glycine oxidase
MASQVLVVGGGVIGLSCAWQLADQGHQVSLVAPNPGHDGASWVAAGMLAPVTEAQFGEAALTSLLLDGAARWKDFATALEAATGVRVGYDQSGTLAVAVDQSDKAALDDLEHYQRSLGLTPRRRTASACRALIPALSPVLRGGLEVADDHQVDNRALLGALVLACAAAGVAMWRDRVRSVRSGGTDRWEAVTEGGTALGADVVVLASGVGTPSIAVPAGCDLPEIRPIKGHVIRLGPAAGVAPLGRTIRALVHGRSVYVVPRSDGSLVIGATMEERGYDVSVQAGAVHQLLTDARSVLPGLDEYEFWEATAGLRPATADNTPCIGWTNQPGLVMATGHYRNGILLAPLTAAAVVGLVAGEPLPAAWAHMAPACSR